MLRSLIGSFISGRWKFEWRYWRGNTPWDTNITPPEVMEFIAASPPGKALDLGCGTGTNAITLARHGWQATGVDFAPKAIRAARRKAKQAGFEIDFHCADASDLAMLTGRIAAERRLGAHPPGDRRGKGPSVRLVLVSAATPAKRMILESSARRARPISTSSPSQENQPKQIRV